MSSPMQKFMMSVPDAMYDVLESEREKRMLDTIQETLRQIVSEYFKDK